MNFMLTTNYDFMKISVAIGICCSKIIKHSQIIGWRADDVILSGKSAGIKKKNHLGLIGYIIPKWFLISLNNNIKWGLYPICW